MYELRRNPRARQGQTRPDQCRLFRTTILVDPGDNNSLSHRSGTVTLHTVNSVCVCPCPCPDLQNVHIFILGVRTNQKDRERTSHGNSLSSGGGYWFFLFLLVICRYFKYLTLILFNNLGLTRPRSWRCGVPCVPIMSVPSGEYALDMQPHFSFFIHLLFRFFVSKSIASVNLRPITIAQAVGWFRNTQCRGFYLQS